MKDKINPNMKVILECLKIADAPMGSWNLSEQLEKQGLRISTATVGRMLKSLEKMGLVKKDGVHGRRITTKGLQALSEKEMSQYLSHHQQNLESMVLNDRLEDYLMILQARRIIEQETARLAALNVDDTMLKEMEELIERQEELQKRGESIAIVDIEFHKRIAQASSNKVLESLYHLLFTYGQQSVAFERLRKNIGRQFSVAHRKILSALQQRDPDASAEAMKTHIDELIQDIEQYQMQKKKCKK